MIKIGDYVTRNSYKNDIVFEVINIEGKNVELIGVNVRLIADAEIKDLNIYKDHNKEDDTKYLNKVNSSNTLNRSEYFYLPGKVLHLDGDKNYLKRCLEFYKTSGIIAYGKVLKESEMHKKILEYLKEINPDILVITGHDAYIKKEKNNSNSTYKNSKNFALAVKEARKYEKSSDKLVIIAGACQSNYEELIKAGSTFASSPKRINIHALDPAIIATSLSLIDRGTDINLLEILSKTKYGKDGIGGLKGKGMMYTGYPRNEV
ncbi:MAG: sporulation peptidase YabG [Bacilli bacterium]